MAKSLCQDFRLQVQRPKLGTTPGGLVTRSKSARGGLLEPSLTIVVPVRNAEGVLREQVQQLLETAEDAASHFEILLVDDDSDDQTEEVARDLAREYPQVRVMRHHRRSGRDAAVRTGLLHSRGNVVFIHDAEPMPRGEELRNVCELGGPKHLVVKGQQAAPLYLRPDLLSRLQTWGMMVTASESKAHPDERPSQTTEAPAPKALNPSLR